MQMQVRGETRDLESHEHTAPSQGHENARILSHDLYEIMEIAIPTALGNLVPLCLLTSQIVCLLTSQIGKFSHHAVYSIPTFNTLRPATPTSLLGHRRASFSQSPLP
jgi:hypothetical protein